MKSLKSISYFFLAFVTAVLLLEGMIRVFYPQGIIPVYTTSKFGITNSLKANYSGRARYLEQISYNIRTNSGHLRHHRNIPYKKPPDTYRILCLGDSILFGYGVANDEIFSFYLEEFLNQYFRNVKFEVINASAPGWGPVEFYQYLQKEGQKYQPDLILMTKFTDDLNTLPLNQIHFDNLHYENIHPDETQIFLDGFRIKPLTQSRFRKILLTTPQIKLYETLARSSHLLHALRYRVNRFLAGNQSAQLKTPLLVRWVKEQELNSTNFSQWVLPNRKISSAQIVKILSPWNKENRKFLDLTQAAYLLGYFQVLDAITKGAGSINAKLLILELPIYQEVFGLTSESQLAYYHPSEHFYLLNLLKSISKYQMRFEIPLFFPGDNHWTPAGHRLAAFLVAQHITLQILKDDPIQENVVVPRDFNLNHLLAEANRNIAPSVESLPKWQFIKSIMYKNQGRGGLARKTLKKYLERFPNDMEAHLQLGLLHLKAKDYEKAIRNLQIASKPNEANRGRALTKLAEVYLQIHDPMNALKILNKAKELGGIFLPEIHNKLGQVFQILNQPQRAESHIRSAINLEPEFYGYLVNYGKFLFLQERYSEALKQFKIALTKDPSQVAVYEGLGGTYWKLRDKKRAIANFKKILAFQPNNEMAKATLNFLKK